MCNDVGFVFNTLIDNRPVAVFIPELSVSASAQSITLTWQTCAEHRGLAFNVYPSEKWSGEFGKLNDVPNSGLGQLSYVDMTTSPGKIYSHVIGVLDGGNESLSASVDALLTESLEFRLSQSYPNPFNPRTTISFTLPERTRVALGIYDIQGRALRALVDEILSPGVKEYEWDGRDTSGTLVSSGVYFCRLEVGNRRLTEKLVFLK